MAALPAALESAIAAELREWTPPRLTRAAEALSRRYREDRPAPVPIVAEDATVAAYVATRMPATYAANRFVMGEVAAALPTLRPERLLDLGAGCGAATWAALDAFPTLTSAHLVDYSRPALDAAGRMLAASGSGVEVTTEVARADNRRNGRYDLAVSGYLFGELTPAAQLGVVDTLVGASDVVMVVEPGTPAGYRRVLAARDRLRGDGWHVLAPCPHDADCPLLGDDWCHFGVRLSRSAAHRVAKGAERNFEDEHYSYVAAARNPLGQRKARVLRHPRTRSGHVLFNLCEPSGTADVVTVAARDKAAYKAARRTGWGDRWPPEK